MIDTIDVLLPTRGEHRWPGAIRACESIAQRADKPESVRILLGLDSDDVKGRTLDLTSTGGIVTPIIADREDTLGAKLNRLNGHSDADARFYFADDVTMATAGWDTVLREQVDLFPDHLCVYTLSVAEQPDSLFAHMPVLTREMTALLGGYAPDVFPFWWWDTWLDEIGELSGRKLTIPVEIVSSLPGQDWRGKTMGLRDVAFWARVFDESRDSRIGAALQILDEIGHPGHKAMMIKRMPWISAWLADRNANLRDPDEASYFERHCTEPGGIEDARYQRVKARAMAFMQAKAA